MNDDAFTMLVGDGQDALKRSIRDERPKDILHLFLSGLPDTLQPPGAMTIRTMADIHALRAATIARAVNHAATVWTGGPCPICRNSSIESDADLVLHLGGASAPAERISCDAVRTIVAAAMTNAHAQRTKWASLAGELRPAPVDSPRRGLWTSFSRPPIADADLKNSPGSWSQRLPCDAQDLRIAEERLAMLGFSREACGRGAMWILRTEETHVLADPRYGYGLSFRAALAGPARAALEEGVPAVERGFAFDHRLRNNLRAKFARLLSAATDDIRSGPPRPAIATGLVPESAP